MGGASSSAAPGSSFLLLIATDGAAAGRTTVRVPAAVCTDSVLHVPNRFRLLPCAPERVCVFLLCVYRPTRLPRTGRGMHTRPTLLRKEGTRDPRLTRNVRLGFRALTRKRHKDTTARGGLQSHGGGTGSRGATPSYRPLMTAVRGGLGSPSEEREGSTLSPGVLSVGAAGTCRAELRTRWSCAGWGVARRAVRGRSVSLACAL